jgi:hypothetical protein
VVHSTSWRHDAESRALILTHVAVIAVTSSPRGLVEQRVERAPLARGGATTPPARMRTEAALSHAMEHLASRTLEAPAHLKQNSGALQALFSPRRVGYVR